MAIELALPLLATPLTLVASDFDGTLSPLVRDPWSAAIMPGARRSLRRLAASPAIDVALISGRGVADLAARARVGGASYRGDHGAEWAEAPRGFRPAALHIGHEPVEPASRAMVARLAGEVPLAIGEPWLVVEVKGAGLTFHFRGAPDVAAARGQVITAADAIDPDGLLERSGGRRALELRPTGASTKGLALRRLIDERRPSAVIMLGDDRNDTLAFDALVGAREAGEVEGLAIAIAGHPDVTADVAARADLLVDGPRETARFLSGLARAAGATAPRER